MRQKYKHWLQHRPLVSTWETRLRVVFVTQGLLTCAKHKHVRTVNVSALTPGLLLTQGRPCSFRTSQASRVRKLVLLLPPVFRCPGAASAQS